MAPKSKELPYAFRERLTFSAVAPPDHPSRVLVDLYPFRPKVNPTDGTPSNRLPLACVLYVPAPSQSSASSESSSSSQRGPRSNDARRTLPQWLYSFCRERALPLIAVDHDYLSEESTPSPSPSSSSAAAPATTLPSTLRDLLLEDSLNWSLLSSGPGAEADSGSVPLEDEYALFRGHGGLDMRRMMIVAAGEAAEEVIRCCLPAGIGESSDGVLPHAPVALTLIDPQSSVSTLHSPLSSSSSSSSNASALFPPTLLLSSPSSPSAALTAGTSADYARSLLAAIRATSPEATVLDELSSPSRSRSLGGAPSRKPPSTQTQRYDLHLLDDAADLQQLRANSNDASSSDPSSGGKTSAASRSAVDLIEGFFTHWLGSAAEEQRQAHPASGTGGNKQGDRIASISKARM